MHHRVQDLSAKVEQYEAGGAVVMLDPQRVRPSKWMNRHLASFSGAKFEGLKAEIAEAGKNIQPIKVRRAVDDAEGEAFEIVYGHRRHRACLELGMPVAAIVQKLTDAELFQEMDRENRQREDLSAWEQGIMYKQALDEGLFPSQKRMAAVLGVQQSNLNTAIRLASLPPEIVDAFPSPLDLQFRWAVPLAQTFERDAALMLTRAEELRQATPRHPAKVVFEWLLSGKKAQPQPVKTEFRHGGKVVAYWSKSASGASVLNVKRGALSEAKERKLLEALQKLFE